MKTKKSNYTDGLNFEVVKSPVYVSINGEMQQVPNRLALVNDSNNTVLSMMSGSYRLFTNEEFTRLTEKIGETFGLELNHYAVHNDGQKVLSVFNTTDDKYKVGDYEFTNHVVLYDSRDGSTKLSVGGSGVLHRCMNMFTSTQVQFSVVHSSKLDVMLHEFELGLEEFSKNQMLHIKRLEDLQRIRANQDDLFQMVSGWVALKPSEVKMVAEGRHIGQKLEEEVSTRKTNIIQGLYNSYNWERKDLGDTGFTLFNAVTHYYTHERNKDVTDLFFGDFGTKESQALKFAEALA